MRRARVRSLAVLVAGALGAFLVGIVALNGLMGLLIRHGDDVEVPDLAGLTPRDARARLAPLSLEMTVKSERPSNLFPAGRIISQKPKPLARVRGGRRIEVIVSTGVDAVAVPALEGSTLREAGFRLLEEGLVAGDSIRVPSPGNAADRILATTPPPGARVARGDRVDFLISEGPPREAFVMPDLTGIRYDDVVSILRDAGFSIGEVRQEEDRRYRDGTVVDQRPLAGSRILIGDPVDIVVAGG
jgi:serine/threonine-protein kinase